MSKSIKLFSSALAIGMLLGTGAGAVTSAVQGTTTVAQASTTRSGQQALVLTSDEVQVNSEGLIQKLNIDDKQLTELLNKGSLSIPAQGNTEDSSAIDITGIDTNALSKSMLADQLDVEADTVPGMSSITFEKPENITTINKNALTGHELTSVELPSVSYIGEEAFTKNKIKTVNLGTKGNPAPFVNWGAFGDQRWDTISTQYSDKIPARRLMTQLGLVHKVNGENVLDNSTTYVYVLPKYHEVAIENNNETAIEVFSQQGGYIEAEIGNELYGTLGINIGAKDGGTPTNPGNNGGDTANPDNGSGNETTPDPAPQPLPQPQPTQPASYPHSVYAIRGMRLHKNVSLTNPTRSYKKQSRAKAANFKIQGVAYDKNGNKRYKVKGGYITASSKYVADSHFRSNKVKRVRVIGNKVNSYKDVKLSSNQKVRSYKKGTKLNVKRIVKQGRLTRFELNNGRYITGNKQLLIMDQK
ncbi:hypothetical protein HC026_03395 [Lactobacillus sp. LC28-10]|uniref:DUF5776 domain-containing protein n=1 Tax=Secundilactobacillus angelensis TaxID=2722706 RepID=A0ABX1KXK8_9LACO|nr:DUF5776 domain-containing protein [Secundilactobacillus angelensis]MCH5461669.1 DUF5776 domain-containing protein [Secundilactobacillus angelensis]NLR17965.1 hypothetical protein [Secundilactobacillus angelensis]